MIPQNQRISITRIGGPEVLQLVDAATHHPMHDEVLIRVEAAGVAYSDVLMRRGLYPNMRQVPFVPGYDVVGTVANIGAGVSGLAPGERVVALTEHGGYSRYVRVKAWRCLPVPRSVDPVAAVAIVLNYTSAFQMIHRVAGVRSGESILIHGAAGGVGTALLQLGKLAGLKLYGTASRGKHDVVKQNGGIPIDYQREDFVDRLIMLTGNGVDTIFDPIGGNHWIRSYRALNLGGTLVMYGASAALNNGERNPASLLPGAIKLSLLTLVPDGRRTVGYYIPQFILTHRQAYREDLIILLRMLKDSEINPLIAMTLPFQEAYKAHDMLESAAISGKIVLTMD